MIAVSNTSPLILLDKINCLWILGKLFEKVYIPQSVNKEWLRPGDYVTPECVVVSELSQESLSKAERLYQDLDRGEADAIALFSDTHRDIRKSTDIISQKIYITRHLFLQMRRESILFLVKEDKLLCQ